MSKHNAANERVKRDYFALLEQAKGRDAATIDRAAKSLARFEEATRWRDFAKFRRERATAFKKWLGEQRGARSREPLSKATIHSTLRDLKAFFEWLAREPDYRAKLHFGDAEYFNPSAKDVAVARAKRVKLFPELHQIEAALTAMPATTALERRDRALVALTALTAARVDALRTFRLGHVDLEHCFIEQDARTVATKFGKTFRTWFAPFSELAETVFRDWCIELRERHGWGAADPLFPAPAMGLSESGAFEAQGLARRHWQSTGPIREAFKRAFAAAGLPYYIPHSFRDTLVHHAMRLRLGPEELKALSQNLGHADVLTTFTSYGSVPVQRQGDLIWAMIARPAAPGMDDATLISELAKRLGTGREDSLPGAGNGL